MSHIANIMKKELREMLTPGSVISVLIMVVLFAGLGGLINQEVESASELPYIGYVGPSEGDYEGWNAYDSLISMYGEYDDRIILLKSGFGEDDAIMDEMKKLGVTSAIAIPDTIYQSLQNSQQVTVGQYYLYEPTGMFGSVSSTVVSSVITMLNSDLSKLILGDGYEFIEAPLVSSSNDVYTIVNGDVYQGITPYDISNEIMSQTMMIPIVIMIIIMMVGSIVISSIGSEKENKTLETLLTMPIKRTTIVSGKILASAIVGLVYGLAYMVGMSIYMGAMTGDMGSGVDLKSLGMSLETTDWILIMISMFLSIVCALGICMILGAFAKNYKSAQTMTLPISILAMIPMFIIMFTGWYGSGTVIQAITFAIPFSHPMMAMQSLMYGDMTLVIAGIAYMAVFAAITIIATVWLYRSDILITGIGQNKFVQKLTGNR